MRKQVSSEIDVTVDPSSETPLYLQIYEDLRQKIASGALRADDKLPSIRALVGSLGVSQVTVEKAYTQLVVEGYVKAQPRSGHVVQRLKVEYLSRAEQQDEAIARIAAGQRANTMFLGHQNPAPPRYDFACCDLAPGSFPRKEWQRLTAEVLQGGGDMFMTAYDNMMSVHPLQGALQGYLARARSVACCPEQVVVCPGTIPVLLSILSLFDSASDLVAQENPGYMGMEYAVSAAGFPTCFVPTGGDPQAYFAALERQRPRIVFATPSNQFPTGRAMPLSERIRLLEYAAAHDAYIIEDDVCSEYRYKTQPVPALKSLDVDERVIYVNSFSKTLSPGLRVAYAVLPPKLLERRVGEFFSLFSYVDAVTQEVLALFVERGMFDQHLRRMRSANGVRHDVLCEQLGRQFGSDVDISGEDSGMHLFVTVHNGMPREQLVAAALAEGVGVYADYTLAPDDPRATGEADGAVVLGFSRIDAGDIAPGVAALRRAWF